MKRFVAIANSFLFCILAASAQIRTDLQTPVPSHYIDVQAGGGIGGLGYELNGGHTLNAPSLFIEAAYTWFILPSAGLQTGIQITRIATTAVLTEPMEWRTGEDGTRLTDYMGEEYTHRASFNDWREKQQIWFLQIPIGARFRHFAAFNSRFGMHAAAGALVSFPISSHYRLLSGSVTHTGWYDQWRLLLHDIPGRFETESFAKQQESFSKYLKPFSLSVYAEAGVLVRLSERAEMMLAAYAQWMPLDLEAALPNEREPLGFASERNTYSFMSEYHGIIGTDKTGAIHPWSAGIKIGLSIWPGTTSDQRRRCMCESMK